VYILSVVCLRRSETPRKKGSIRCLRGEEKREFREFGSPLEREKEIEGAAYLHSKVGPARKKEKEKIRYDRKGRKKQ